MKQSLCKLLLALLALLLTPNWAMADTGGIFVNGSNESVTSANVATIFDGAATFENNVLTFVDDWGDADATMTLGDGSNTENDITISIAENKTVTLKQLTCLEQVTIIGNGTLSISNDEDNETSTTIMMGDFSSLMIGNGTDTPNVIVERKTAGCCISIDQYDEFSLVFGINHANVLFKWSDDAYPEDGSFQDFWEDSDYITNVEDPVWDNGTLTYTATGGSSEPENPDGIYFGTTKITDGTQNVSTEDYEYDADTKTLLFKTTCNYGNKLHILSSATKSEGTVPIIDYTLKVSNNKEVTFRSFQCDANVQVLGNGTLTFSGSDEIYTLIHGAPVTVVNLRHNSSNSDAHLLVGGGFNGNYDKPIVNIRNNGTGSAIMTRDHSYFCVDHANVNVSTNGGAAFYLSGGVDNLPIMRNCTYNITRSNGRATALTTSWTLGSGDFSKTDGEEFEGDVTVGDKTIKLTYKARGRKYLNEGYNAFISHVDTIYTINYCYNSRIYRPATDVAIVGASNPNNVSGFDLSVLDNQVTGPDGRTYNVVTIYENAFKDVDFIGSLTINKYPVNTGYSCEIDEGAFKNMTNLQSVTFSDDARNEIHGQVAYAYFSNITSGNDLNANPLPPVELHQPWGFQNSGWRGGNWNTFIVNLGATNGSEFMINCIIETTSDGDTPGTARIESLATVGNKSNTNRVIPEVVTSVGNNGQYAITGIRSLADCDKIESLTIPASVTTIGSEAFKDCANLKTVNFLGAKPAVEGNVETGMFSGIAADPDLRVVAWEPSWDNIIASKTWGGVTWNTVAYYDENKPLKSFSPYIDENGDIYSFEYTSGKPQVHFNINYHGNNTAELTSIFSTDDVNKLRIPATIEYNNVTYTIKQVNAEALKNSSHFSELIIPSGIKIEADAFKNLTKMEKVTFEDGCVKSDYGAIFSGITGGYSLSADPLSPVELIYPASWGEVATNWAGGNWLFLPANEFIEKVTVSCNTASSNTVDLRLLYEIIDADNKKVSLVKLLDAPAGNVKNYELTIPNTVNTDYTVTTIGTEAFKDIDWLYSITMPSGLTEIEDDAFVNLTNLYRVSVKNITANKNIFNYGDNDVKFRNIKYSDTQKTYLIQKYAWSVSEEWGGGTVAIWQGDYVGTITRYGIFVNGLEVSSKNESDVLGDGKVTYSPSQSTGGDGNHPLTYYAKITLKDGAVINNIRNSYVNNDKDTGKEKAYLMINVVKDATISSDTESALICNFNTIVRFENDGSREFSSSASGLPTISVADGVSFKLEAEDRVRTRIIERINNTGGAPCISIGTGSTVSLYGNYDMTTNGTAVAPDLTATAVEDGRVIAGGFDESTISIRKNLNCGDNFTRDIEFNDEKVLRLTFCVTDADEKTVSWCMGQESSNPYNVSDVDLVVPTTVVGPDGIEYAVTSIATMALSAEFDETTFEYTPISYVRSLVIPETIEEIQTNALFMVSNLQSVEFKMPYTDLNEIDAVAFFCITSGGSDKIDTSTNELAEDAPAVTLIFPEGSPAVGPTWAGGNWAGDFVDENAIMPGDEITDQRLEITAEKEGDVPGSLAVNYVITKVPSESAHGEVMIWMPDEGNNYAGEDYSCEGLNAVSDPRDANNEEDESIIGTLSIPSTITVGEGEDAKIYDVTEIGANAFSSWQDLGYNCPWINNVILPETIKEIYGFAFDSNETLTSVTFKGARVDELGVYMIFSSIAAALTVPASWGLVADDWEDGRWTSINYVKEVELDEEGNEVETTPVNFAVADADEQTMEVTSSETLAEEGTVVIPQTMALGDNDFTVTAIGYGAFKNQTNLTGVTLPKTVTSIGENAFAGCTNMTSLKLQSPFAPVVIDNSFSGANENLTVFYPAAAYNNYNDAGWTGVATFQPTVMQPNEWSTICSTQDYEVPEGLEAYVVVGIDYENCAVKVKKMDYILADTPMMLRKIGAAEDYPVESLSMFIYQPDGEQLPKVIGDEDAFVGYAPASADAAPMELPESSGNNNMQAYILIGNSFVRWTSGTLAPYRCFLWATQEFNTASPARMAIEVVDGEATGVSDVRGKKEDVRNNWYDLSGRRLQSQPTKKGVYVNNGKLMIK